MGVQFPDLPIATGLGVGLDLPWGAGPGRAGFERDPTLGDRVRPGVVRFFEAMAKEFQTAFVSWQPKSRSRLRLDDYAPAWDTLFSRLPAHRARALHQTVLNLGALEPYDRSEICAFTNQLCRRYDLKWVNEDLGVWSLRGRPLPYPLPPFLTDRGLAASVANVRDVMARLDVPLLVEFPGFSEGTSVSVGTWHAYDFLRALADETQCGVTLDLGHLLSYQWVRGARGPALRAELERLPLAACAEIHLSGTAIHGEEFFDCHDGILLPDQLTLLAELIPLCPNLRVVTYEDPRFDDEGALVSETVASFEALRAEVRRWLS